jgi:hypothetical protein
MDVAHSDFFWAKSRQMATQFSENGIFRRKFLRKKFAKKRQKTGFFGDGVTAFMATGYSFQSFLKYIRQLSRNLPRCSPLWLHQETGKKNTGCTCFSTMEQYALTRCRILSTPICFFNNGMVFVGKHGRLSTME